MTNQELYELMTRFERSCIQSIKLTRGDFSVELCKASAASGAATAAVVPATPAPQVEETGKAITAPLVGTYYEAASPGAKPFVAVGDRVQKGQTVCLIEAMKMISEIPAPCDCVITEILKENGSMAAFGEPLFRYQPC